MRPDSQCSSLFIVWACQALSDSLWPPWTVVHQAPLSMRCSREYWSSLPFPPPGESHCFSVQFSSVAQFCPTPCDPMNRSTPGLPVHHELPSDCNHEIKRHLLLGRKAVTNLDSILKSRDVTLPTKAHLVRAMVSLVVIYECESWTIKKAEYQRIDVFELWCWRRLLRVPWTARDQTDQTDQTSQS